MKAPHILIASGNVFKLRTNLAHILDATALRAIDAEVQKNVKQLVGLGRHHFKFAATLSPADCRQMIPLLYYAAYNTSGAVRLGHDGVYSQDPTDHKKVGELPAALPQQNTFAVQLPHLRDDRNLCDYDHTALVTDLMIPPADALTLVDAFITEARMFLGAKGFPT